MAECQETCLSLVRTHSGGADTTEREFLYKDMAHDVVNGDAATGRPVENCACIGVVDAKIIERQRTRALPDGRQHLFEEGGGVLSIRAGEAIVLPLAAPYRMEMDAAYDGLFLIFDPLERPEWSDLWGRLHGRVIEASAALFAAGASVRALMRYERADRTDRMAVDATLDLVLRASMAGESDVAPPRPEGRLRNAAHLVELHVDDSAYGPDALARDLAMSRRSLYAGFARIGLTPAGFLRKIRLQRARSAVLQSRGKASA